MLTEVHKRRDQKLSRFAFVLNLICHGSEIFFPVPVRCAFFMVISPASYVKHMVPSYVNSLIYWMPSVWHPPLNWSLERS